MDFDMLTGRLTFMDPSVYKSPLYILNSRAIYFHAIYCILIGLNLFYFHTCTSIKSKYCVSVLSLARESGCIMDFDILMSPLTAQGLYYKKNWRQCMYWWAHRVWHHSWTFRSHGRQSEHFLTYIHSSDFKLTVSVNNLKELKWVSSQLHLCPLMSETFHLMLWGYLISN